MKLFPGPWFRVATSNFQNPLALVGSIYLCLSPIAARGQSVSFRRRAECPVDLWIRFYPPGSAWMAA